MFDEMYKAGMEGRVYYFLPYGKKPINSDHKYVDVRYCYYKWEKFIFHIKHMHVLRDFESYIQNKSFDLVYAHSLFSNGYIAYQAKLMHGYPYIVYVQNTDLNVFFKYRIFLRKIGGKILKNADKIVFPSTSYLDLCLKYFHSESDKRMIRNKSVIIPYGINNLFFEDAESCIDKREKKDSKINILTVGTICSNKNQKKIIESAKILRRRGYDVHVTVIGHNKNNHIYRLLRRQEDVDVLDFMSKNKLKTLYQTNDVFCLPSKTETFGLVYAEALSQGLPIIYTRGQGFDKQFEEGMVGYGVDSKSENQIADAILRLKKRESQTLSKTCERASEKFKWTQIISQYKKIFEEILE